MDERPDVAVVGGGIVGASVLYHLADRGLETTLFERDQLASGSTSRAVGGVRHLFSHPANVEAGVRNLAFYRNFEAEVGTDLELDETGYLYVARSGAELDRWADRAERFDEHGLDTRLLDPAGAAELVAGLDAGAIEGAFYAPDCLHLDPYTATRGFADAAVGAGAAVHTKTAVEGIEVEDGAVSAVHTEAGTVEPDVVVNAAGPWGPEIAAEVGVGLPIDRFARRIAVTEETDAGAGPLVIDPEGGCYFRTERNGSLLACDTGADVTDVADPAAAASPGYDYYLGALSKVERLVPGVRDREVINGWAGVQTATPDGHPILGPTAVEGFLAACGFNGLGVMSAPTVGRAIADVVADGTTDVLPVDRLGPDRFDRPAGERIEPEEMA